MKEIHKIRLVEVLGPDKAEAVIKKLEEQENFNNIKNEEMLQKEAYQRNELIKKTIPKCELIDGVKYFGICERLEHNKEAVWNGNKKVFLVEKYEMWGLVKDFEIDHIEDTKENNLAGFAPLKIVE